MYTVKIALAALAATFLLGTGCAAGTTPQKAVPATNSATFTTFPPPTTSTSTTTTTVDTATQRHFARTPAPDPIASRPSVGSRDWAAEDLERRIARIERAQREQEFHDFYNSP